MISQQTFSILFEFSKVLFNVKSVAVPNFVCLSYYTNSRLTLKRLGFFENSYSSLSYISRRTYNKIINIAWYSCWKTFLNYVEVKKILILYAEVIYHYFLWKKEIKSIVNIEKENLHSFWNKTSNIPGRCDLQ